MTLKTFSTGAVALALVLAAMGAQAHDGRGGDARHGPRGGPAMSLERLDANGDGTVSAEEFADPAAARFAAADADGDGELTAAEMAAAAETRREARRAARIARHIERLDSDGNGTLSLAEIQAPRDRGALFERLDSDGDGALSAEELRGARAPRPEAAPQ
ncbi:EF-hand domain-containing protein [Roseivivax sp. CAU 1761]